MYLSDLILEATTPDNWTVRAPLIWSDPIYGAITVPVGFSSDLASIPRALRSLEAFDPNGISRRPAVTHDWLYGGDRSRGKEWADAFLRAALLAEGMGEDLAYTYWLAVHEFGLAAWNGDKALAAAWARGPLTDDQKRSAIGRVAGSD